MEVRTHKYTIDFLHLQAPDCLIPTFSPAHMGGLARETRRDVGRRAMGQKDKKDDLLCDKCKFGVYRDCIQTLDGYGYVMGTVCCWTTHYM